jgi:hypothetical protein
MVVGAPHDVVVAPATATVQADSTDDCKATDATSTELDQAALAANVTDSDGNALVGIPVDWASSAATTVKVDAADGSDTTVGTTSFTVNSSVGINAFAVACGLKVGSADVSATINSGAVNEDTDSATVTVVGAPASITLAANPPAIACTGTSTSTVTATVKDSGGNNVVNGTTVTFSVVALGTANPINATTTDGMATSVITPLSGNTAGTIVNVSAGSAAASLRIDCLPSLATATAAAGATATPVGGIVGPNTGTGRYLGQDSGSSFPMWALAALALGSLVLVGGGIAARRAGK